MDSLLMSLKLIQGFHLEEIRRGKAGLGTFNLKRKYSRFASNILEFESRKLVLNPKDIVASIRDKDIKEAQFHDEKSEEIPKCDNADNSRILRAKLLVALDSIAFSAKLGIFTVVDQHAVHTVRLYPNAVCSCPVKKNCVHIFGVKLGHGMEINDDDLGTINLAVVRKNHRYPAKQKPGRKRPRAGEIPNKAPMTSEHLTDALTELEQSMRDMVDRMKQRQDSISRTELPEYPEKEPEFDNQTSVRVA